MATSEALLEYVERGTESDELVVVLHGFATPDNRLQDVRRLVREAKPNADIYAPLLPYRRRLSCTVSAEKLTVTLLSELDTLVADSLARGKDYLSIIFIGHSNGAVLARRLVVAAFGEQSDERGSVSAPFEPELQNYRERRGWAPKISRLILLAGMNRGWSVESTKDWWTSVVWSLGQLYSEYVLRGKATTLAIRRGAPYIVQTRLQWLSLMNCALDRRPKFLAVQLLGSIDDHVAPSDSIDWSVDVGRTEADRVYYYLEVPHTSHYNVVKVPVTTLGTLPPPAHLRKQRILLALLGSRVDLARASIGHDEASDSLVPVAYRDATDVVFIIHGIRDRGHWTQKVARSIKRKSAALGRSVATLTATYGYLALAPFVLRAVRQRKVEWLMDHYVEARALYPNATIHYIGHSNGTYLLAQALRDYPAAQFGNVVFAGSVVRSDFDWVRLTEHCGGNGNRTGKVYAPRVRKLLNYVATSDWVVALFPKGFQAWNAFNLGGAGHDGFGQAAQLASIHQLEYVRGGHGAGVEEFHWDEIAEFIMTGVPPTATGPRFSATQSRLWKYLGRLSFLSLPLITLLLGASIAGLAIWVGGADSALVGAWRTLVVTALLSVLYLLLTRF